MCLKSKIALYRLLLVLILATLSTLPVYPLSYSTATDTTDSDFGAGLVKSSVTIVGTGDPAFVEISITSSSANSQTWLTGWKYRRAININNSLAYGLSDYQVWIPTSAFGSAWTDIKSKAKSNMDDFRFTPSTATTTIPYWIDDNTTTPKGFWVKVSTLVAGANTIYMYYGNPSASVGQSGDNTFIFFDDFSINTIGTKWNVQAGNWSIHDGVLEQMINNTGNLNIYTTLNHTNIIIETKQKTINTGINDYSGINVRDQGDGRRYLLNWHCNSGTTNAIAIDIYRKTSSDGDNSNWTPLSSYGVSFPANTWHRLNGIAYGNTLQIILDNIYVSSSTDNTYTTGSRIGLRSEGNNLWDWYFARKYSPTEPTISSVGSEEGPYFPSGEFQSRVIDTGKKGSMWGNISWGQNLPDGTSIKLKTRTGDTSTPDGSWSSWSPSSEWFTINSGTPIASPRARYIQYISSFTTNVSTSTPQLLEVTIQYATNTATAPNLVNPSDGVWLSTTQPVFVWNFVDNELDTQTGFRLQIATHTNRSTGAPYGFTGNIIYDSGEVASSTSQHQPTAQIPNGFLYWVVKTSDTYGEWSVYSSTYWVKLDTQPPTGHSVISFASGVSSLTITCANGSDGNGAGLHTNPYYIEISTNANFSSAVNSGWVANSYTFNNLLRNKKYYARIKARDILGNESVWSVNFEWKTRPGTYQAKTSQGEPARTGQNAFGLVGDGLWEWQIPVKSGLPLTITCYIQYNTEYGGSTTKPKLTLYGKGISPTSVSATSAAENTWELLTINAGTPSGNAMLKLRAEGFSTNPGAKFYIDDIKVNQ